MAVTGVDIDEESKPSEERVREALENAPAGDTVETFVVVCPMCTTMYEDGTNTGGREDDIEMVDVAELLAEAIATGAAPDASVGADADGQPDGGLVGPTGGCPSSRSRSPARGGCRRYASGIVRRRSAGIRLFSRKVILQRVVSVGPERCTSRY